MASSLRYAKPMVFPPSGRHTATVIFAHGLGDSGHGWASAVEHWRRRQRLDEVKFILPHAPSIPISVNGGFQMPGWFDIFQLGGSVEELRKKAATEDGPGILASREYFNNLIQEEISAGIPSERIVLGGFSQGGAMSILTGVTSPVKLGGIIGLSSWLLLSQSVKEHIPESNPNKDTPIFMGHGDQDPVVRYELGSESSRILKDLGYNVDLNTYRGMEHSACLEELDEVEKYLVERLPAKGNN
ncbi:acyl-protein thioesterase-1-like protein [Sarocladium strictum]